jgi:hypothetical protein
MKTNPTTARLILKFVFKNDLSKNILALAVSISIFFQRNKLFTERLVAMAASINNSVT